ncbi:MAG TPA: cellulase family glycosylhydrolase [Thermoleophilia bacterium]|nr:cellulase family glycosylhydrolase [Thermoleophilia bacterium]
MGVAGHTIHLATRLRDGSPTRRAAVFTLATVVLVVAAVVAALSLAAPPAAQAALLRGLDDPALPTLSQADRDARLHEIGAQLRATVVRLDCEWPHAEPDAGVYTDDGYLGGFVATAEALHAQGVKVIVTINHVPRWASDSAFWNDPPSSAYSGYQVFYPIREGALDNYSAFATHLAKALKGVVLGYEAFNEPNLWTNLYPQRTAGDHAFAAHRYVQYLKAFQAGVRAGDPDALVAGGATAPHGSNDAGNTFWTSPQAFANAFKAAGGGQYCDVYSHHPYVPGSYPSAMDPALPPLSPSQTVSLQNVDVLLKLFPKKPFWMTEYGFSTADSIYFGAGISERAQAAYLKKGYAMAARHPQIKMLVWYLLQDVSPTGDSSSPKGWYLGLRRVAGGAKPAWYAFAGGNRISLTAPKTARRRALIRLSARYTCASIGGVKGKRLALQHKVGGKPWATMRWITTGDDGRCTTRLRFGGTQRYRLVWPGVVTGVSRLVRMR